MKRLFLITMVTIVVISLAVGCQNQNTAENGEQENNENQVVAESKIFKKEFSTDRNVEDYKEELKKLVNADEAGEVKYPEDNQVKYPFISLKKDGELIGYGTWVSQIIYQHPEDMIAVVTPDVKILKWKPIDANEHHPELKEEKYLKKYYDLTLDKKFDPGVDVISGSTISSNTFFFELRNILLVFKEYGPQKTEEK